MSDQKLSIQIETTATGQGVQQTAAGLDKLAGSAQKAAPAVGQLGGQTKQTAAELGRGVEVGNAASMMVQNLASSTKGGASGFLSLARGAFGAGVALKGVLASMGPFGAIAAGIGLALGLITAALRKNEEAAEAQRKKLEEVNQQKLDKAIEEQSKLGRAAGEAVEQIEAERAALERIADAELALRKSRIDADKSLSPEEKERQKLALDRQREDEKRAGILADQETKANKLQEAASKSRKAAENVEGEYNRQRNALDELTAATKAYADAKAIVDMQAFAGGEASPEDQSALLAARNRQQRAESYATGVTPDTLAAAEAAAKKAREQANADRDRAESARTGADLEHDTQQAEDIRRNETRRNQDIANRPETEAEKAAAEKARAKQDEQIRRTPAAIWNNKIATGGDVDMEALRRNFPDYKWADAPEWKRKQQTTPMTPPSVAAAQPATPAAAVSPGLGVVPADTALPAWQQSPNTAMQLGGGRLPSDLARTGLPGGITAGPSSGGSDGKTAKAIDGATGAMNDMPTGEDTSKSAEALKAATEQAAQAQQAASEATQAALAATAGVQQEQAGKLGEVVAACNTLSQQQQQLAGQVAFLRLRIANLA